MDLTDITYPGYKLSISLSYSTWRRHKRNGPSIRYTLHSASQLKLEKLIHRLKKREYILKIWKSMKFSPQLCAIKMKSLSIFEHWHANIVHICLRLVVFTFYCIILRFLLCDILYTTPQALCFNTWRVQIKAFFSNLLYSVLHLVESSCFPVQAYNCIVTRVFNLVIITLDGEFY